MRREHWHTGRPARSGDRRAEAVGTEVLEDTPLGRAVVARDEIEHGREDRRRNRYPAGATRLAYGLRDAPA
jgi:hypothetical protein